MVFEKYGRIKYANHVSNFAFVQFGSPEAAERALASAQGKLSFFGLPAMVDRARPHRNPTQHHINVAAELKHQGANILDPDVTETPVYVGVEGLEYWDNGTVSEAEMIKPHPETVTFELQVCKLYHHPSAF